MRSAASYCERQRSTQALLLISCTKELMNVLFQSGYKVGFTIIEQAFMLNFYQSIDSKAYFHSGYCDINGDGINTYRGFWNFESMVDTFKRTDFRDYKRRIRVIRQNTEVNEHA